MARSQGVQHTVARDQIFESTSSAHLSSGDGAAGKMLAFGQALCARTTYFLAGGSP
jgi:hypothetical protein